MVLSLASIKCRSASAGTFSPSAKPIILKQQPGAERGQLRTHPEPQAAAQNLSDALTSTPGALLQSVTKNAGPLSVSGQSSTHNLQCGHS